MLPVLCAHWWLATSAAGTWSNAFDEALHQTAGYAYWRFDDYRLHAENGNLPQRLFALPLALDAGRWHFPATGPTDAKLWNESSQWGLAWRFYFGEGNDFRAMLRQGRAVAASIGTALVALVWWWSRSLFGPVCGMVSLLLAALSPNLLAHGSLMTSDVTLALTLAAFLGALWISLQRVSPWTLVASGAAAGALLLSKFSAPIAAPMAAGLWALRVADGRPLPVRLARRERRIEGRAAQAAVLASALAAQLALALVLVWAAYGFRYAALAPGAAPGAHMMEPWSELLALPGPLTSLVAFARDHQLLPEAWLYGLAFVREHARARFAFAAGHFGVTGWWWFFPYAFAVKTPLSLLGLLALAAAAAWRLARRAPQRLRERAYAAAPLAVLVAVYWAASLATPVNVGLRHVLPTYPALFVLAGAAGRWIEWRRRAAGALAALLLASFAVSSFAIRPHYLAYFNALVGPANGWRALVDSSLDWGQDLPGLADWLRRHRAELEHEPVWLSYFGSSSPPAWGVEALALPSYHDWPRPGPDPVFALRGGLYCISATMLQAVYAQPPGPWTAASEAQYQQVRPLVLPLLRGELAPDALHRRLRDPAFAAAYRRYHRLRFARLAAFLRARGPDDSVGYSILIFRLSDAEVRAALDGPAPTEDLP